MRRVSLILPFLLTRLLFAEPAVAPASKLSHESEASAVLASGNTDARTFALKQSTAYQWDKNKGTFTGSLLYGKSGGIESARKWDLGVRFDRELSEVMGLFLGYQIDGNIFSGFESRHTVDLGGKYYFIRTDETKLSTEAGYRYQAEKLTSQTTNNNHMGRAFLEWTNAWNKQVNSKVGTEFTYNFSTRNDYRINAEPSLSVILTDVLSIKLAYLINFRNLPAVAGKKQLDTLYTTSLVAKL